MKPLPAGTRDWLPAELRRKFAVEVELRRVFERSAYAEVQTPGLERFDALEASLGDHIAKESFLFTDRSGTQVALRPEMTTPVARLVSSRMRDVPQPIRLCYIAPTYRSGDVDGSRMCESTTAGIEYIGPASVDADAESLFTALEAFDALGLHDARFDINHVAIVDGILAGIELDGPGIARAKSLISKRNIVELRRHIVGKGSVPVLERIIALTLQRGGEDVLDAAAALCQSDGGFAGIERLRQILERAARSGYAERINVDCSLLRDYSYYTGFIFEGFVADIGFPLCGGGRYDDLLPSFGFAADAVGWSLTVERLLLVLERRRR